MISFERIELDKVTWKSIEEFGECNVFQTRPWINYLKETQGAEPVITTVKLNGNLLGYFTGLIVRKMGLKILGSPFRGWTTYFMGFNLVPGAPYCDILKAFPSYVFKDLGCHYLELVDPNIKKDDFAGLPYKVEALPWYAIDLTKSEDDLWSAMKSAGRNCIRKSVKNGVVVEEAPAVGFAEEYIAEYTDVLENKELSPTYNVASVSKLIDYLGPSGNLQLLHALGPDQRCLATGAFLGYNKTAVFWGAASWKEHQPLRPNEPIAWKGILDMKARGYQILHFGGECDEYKKKLGCDDVAIFRLMKAKYSFLETLLDKVRESRDSKYRNWALRKLGSTG